MRECRGDREVYTPQVVVNGVVHVLGSDKAAIEKAIAQTRPQSGGHSSLPVSMAVADGKVTVKVPPGGDKRRRRRSLAVSGHRQSAG